MKSGRRLWARPSGTVLVVLALGMATAVAGCTEEGGASASDGGVRLWKKHVAVDARDTDLWVTERHVMLRAGDGRLEGRDPRTGTRKWSLKPPEGMGLLCAVAPPNEEGIAAAAYGQQESSGTCPRLAAVDTRTGERLWEKRLPGKESTYVRPSLTVGDKAIGVAPHSGPALRVSLRSGDVVSRHHEGCPACPSTTAAIDRRLVTLSAQNIRGRQQLTAYDVDSGRRVWRREERFTVPAVFADTLSGRPLITSLMHSAISELRTYDDHGKLLHEVGGTNEDFSLVPYADGAPVGKRRLVVQHDDWAGSGRDLLVGDLHAYEPRTGKRLWRLRNNGSRQFDPSGIAGDRLYGVVTERKKRGTGKSRQERWFAVADLDSGRVTKKGAVPSIDNGSGNRDMSVTALRNDDERMYLVQESGRSEYYLTAYPLPDQSARGAR
ncbi:PQQ-binding-like beta-propeller repeat protein [Streptomyces iconiensis]|uniref:outer membrane protein assembly factor BamB family protein n=1 Tax=Streptomyces iconiensis TaxID=1384038 RepID=UPI00247D9597